MPQPTNATNQIDVHTKAHNRVFDVKAMFGAVGDGTADDTTALSDAMTAAAAVQGDIVLPPGSYKIADSSSITLAAGVTVRGSGRGTTGITVKNAYAFKTPATGNLDHVNIRDLDVVLRSGATTGGGVKAVSNSYHNSWTLERVDVVSLTGCTEPPIWVDGWIGSSIIDCNVGGASAPGIFVDSTGFVSNAHTIERSRCYLTQGSTTGALKVQGGSLARIRDCTIETNRGYGIHLIGVNTAIIDGVWFEDNSNHNVFAADSLLVKVVRNKFHYNHGDIGTADHVNLTRASGDNRDFHTIEENIFQDASSTAVGVRVGANVADTLMRRNRGVGHVVSHVDGGLRTRIEEQDAYVETIASAATVTLNDGGNFFIISGTTTITSVTASWEGRMVALAFSGALTVTDGSNLALAGNFVTTPGDTITLMAGNSGTWYEVARSVN